MKLWQKLLKVHGIIVTKPIDIACCINHIRQNKDINNSDTTACSVKDVYSNPGGMLSIAKSCLAHKKFHQTWKFLKGMSLVNTDSDFATHLLSLKMSRVHM